MKGFNLTKLLPWKRIGCTIAGLILLALLVGWGNPALVFAPLLKIGPLFGLIVTITALGFILQTLCWKLTLKAGKVPLPVLFKLKVGGEALNRLARIFPIKGMAVSVPSLRKRYQIPDATDSIVIEQRLQFLAQVFLAGLALMVGCLGTTLLPPLLRWGGVLVALIVMGTMLRAVKTARLCCRCSPAAQGQWEEASRLMKRFVQAHPTSFYFGLLLQLLAQTLLVLEVWLLGRTLLPEFSLPLALILYSLTPLIFRLFIFTPGAFGFLEIVMAGILFMAFGGTGFIAGLALQLIRRLRALFWIVVGLALVGNPFKVFFR